MKLHVFITVDTTIVFKCFEYNSFKQRGGDVSAENVKPFSSNECSECMQSGVYHRRIFPEPLHFYEHTYEILCISLLCTNFGGVRGFYCSIHRRVIRIICKRFAKAVILDVEQKCLRLL